MGHYSNKLETISGQEKFPKEKSCKRGVKKNPSFRIMPANRTTKGGQLRLKLIASWHQGLQWTALMRPHLVSKKRLSDILCFRVDAFIVHGGSNCGERWCWHIFRYWRQIKDVAGPTNLRTRLSRYSAPTLNSHLLSRLSIMKWWLTR